jgi:hypothetical protein
MGLSLLPTAALPESDFQVERTGAMIGRYKLLEKIGEGGFGVVFMAEQQEPVQRKVALKIIKAGMDTKEVIARFETERQAIALMDHPNIARALDAGATEAGRPYFVMELVRGIPITEYCDRGHLPTHERLQLFIKVCQAVQHAHQKGVIHRDLKPSNVLVTEHDGEPVPKVIDFGVAKALGQKLTEKTLFTGFQHMIGTPAYMSPEQAALSGLDIDTRADIYSLGVLLYELLTGVTPFAAETFRKAAMDEIRRMIRETEPPKPSTRLQTMGDKLADVAMRRATAPAALGRLIRGDLDWIVMRCLEKDRKRRYETASGLAADVTRHLKSEPVVARPPSELYRLQKLVRRHKLVLGAAGAVAAALVLALGISLRALVREATFRRLTSKEADRANQALNSLRLQKAEELFKANETPAALAYLAEVLRQNLTNEAVAGRVFSNITQQVLVIPFAKPLVHRGAVYFAQFSPDGQLVVTASADRTAQVWNASSGEPITPPLRHNGPVWFAQFSPDGQRVVTASEDGTARVWNAHTGQALLPPLEHSWSVGYAYFSPDGKRIVTDTWEPDWTLRLWSAETGRLLAQPITNVHRLRCYPFSADGRKLVTSFGDNSAQIWDAMRGAPLLLLKHDNVVWTAEFSPNGQRVVTACGDGIVRILDALTGKITAPLLPHGESLWTAHFNHDGQRVITVCNDMTIQIWDANTGRARSAPLDCSKQLDPAKYEEYEPRVGPVHCETPRYAHFSPDGKMVLMTFGRYPQLLDAESGSVLTGPIPLDIVRSAEFSRDGHRVIAASLNGTARIWGIRSRPQWPSDLSHSARFSPAPEWVSRLLEALAEKRVNEEGVVEAASPSQFQMLTRELAESTATDAWTLWGKWLCASPKNETEPSR